MSTTPTAVRLYPVTAMDGAAHLTLSTGKGAKTCCGRAVMHPVGDFDHRKKRCVACKRQVKARYG